MRFRNTYRIDSQRKPLRDYSSPGAFLVTFCTHGRYHFFGEVRKGIMGLSDAGCIVAQEIQRTSLIRSHVKIDSWIVMPNHIHMIVVIQPILDNIVEMERRSISTEIAERIPLQRRKSNSLGSIVQSIKCVCTNRIRLEVIDDFAWQSNFHDRIIGNYGMLNNMRRYIVNNPRCWDGT